MIVGRASNGDNRPQPEVQHYAKLTPPDGASVDLYWTVNTKKAGGVFVLTHAQMEVGMMKNKRTEISDRRHDYGMPEIPFMDSNGAIIKECRRKVLDRRIANIQAEWVDIYQ